VDDAADDAAVIDTVSTFAAMRQKRLDPPPLRIAQPIDLTLRYPSLRPTSDT